MKLWLDKSAAQTDIDACTDFLLGRNVTGNEHVPCKTQEQIFDDENIAPFYAYKRYHVTYPDTPKKKKVWCTGKESEQWNSEKMLSPVLECLDSWGRKML